MTVSSKLGVWKLTLAALTAATIAVTGFAIEKAKAAEDPIYMPLLVYRTGAYAPNGIPFANGQRDFLQMLMNRDGGINGVPLEWDECEMRYDTAMGVECYQRVKDGGAKGAAVIVPLSTGITYAVMDVAGEDKIPVHSMGYGRSAASYGKVFEWTFTSRPPTGPRLRPLSATSPSRKAARRRSRARRSASSTTTAPMAASRSRPGEAGRDDIGFEFVNYAVDHPGQEQSATWLSIRRDRPDWLMMWGWGVMNQVAVTEAVRTGYNMERFLGVWWSGSEPDVRAAGAAAAGYKAGNFHGIGTDSACCRMFCNTSITATRRPRAPTTGARCSTTGAW
jgi:branched-chain amino acid transport system substrate-binding protein